MGVAPYQTTRRQIPELSVFSMLTEVRIPNLTCVCVCVCVCRVVLCCLRVTPTAVHRSSVLIH